MRVIWRIVGLAFRKYKRRLALAYVSVFGAALFALAIPRIVGDTVNRVLASEGAEVSQLYVLAGVLLLVGLARGLFAFGQTYLGEALSQMVAYDIRNSYFDRLQRLSFGFHDRQMTGNLMSRATADVEGVRMFMSMGVVRSAFVVVMVLGIAAVMLLTHWQLALVSLAFVPFIAYRAVTMSRRLRVRWMSVQERTGEMVTVLQENLSGMRVVKAFAAEEHEKERFGVHAGGVAEETMGAERLGATTISTMGFAFLAAIGLILWFGGWQVINGAEVVDGQVVYTNLTPGELTAFMMYMGLLAMPIRMMGWLVNTFARAASCGERIFEILDTESPVQEKLRAVDPGRVRGRVTFRNVSFAYNPDVPVLKNVDLTVEPGNVIALLGHAGSGKSTLVHLLPRFYDASQGQVTIDGIDLRDVTLASLRRNVGIVQQDVFIHTASARDNIAYGVPGASLEEVVRVAKIAQLHDFIEALPQGYDTWVGERGVALSGGQRQRLAIARTLLLDPPVLIMDDSTSSVDAETEHLIQQALAEVIRGRTTFVITHRLSTIRNADLILVFEDGEIVERGTHQELLEKGGEYKVIYDLQLRPQEEAASQMAFSPTGEEGT